jgi:DNA helicase II / ATP-dependent DNA helicase PcrA
MKVDYEAIFQENYARLNPAQKDAVDTIDGPVMVLAGPGAGKTQLLSLRVANILKETDTRPFNILCLTFTDSGAKNMKERLSTIIGPDAYKVNISTFHGFAKMMMNLHPEKFFDGASPKVLDDYSRKLLYKSILSEVRKTNYKNSLVSHNKEQGFVYQKAIDSRIKQFKNNGITPAMLEKIIDRNNAELEYLKPLLNDFFGPTTSTKMYANIPALLKQLSENCKESSDKLTRLGDIDLLTNTYINRINAAYELYRNDATLKSKPLTEFKANFLTKVGKNYWPKEAVNNDKYSDLIEVFYAYEDKQNESANIDFDDIIRIFVDTLEQDEEFRLSIQTKYQYILVDEFQDTSTIQLNLISNLFDLKHNEGKPNILVVGDDDQSIYKFQGANIENINKFIKYFPQDPKLIILDTNYRSSTSIVELAQEIVDMSNDSFSKRKGFDKTITAHKKDEGNINYLKYNTFYDEVADICKRIKELSDAGTDLSEICILARGHKTIVPFARHLEKLGLPLKYEKGQDILKSEHILELIKLSELILNVVDAKFVDPLLSEVLCSEYWKLKSIDIYHLASVAKKLKQPWLDTMLKAEEYNLNTYLKEIALWLIDVSAIAKRYSAERLLDILIGQKSEEGSEQGEIEFEANIDPELQKWRDYLAKISKFSPFGRYYYNLDRMNLEYLATLSALKTLINRVRDYRQNSFLRIGDLVEFFNFHIEEKIAIIDNNVFNQDAKAVSLMTSHKAKGLEFEHVFVVSSNDSVWFEANKFPNLIPMLSNLPFEALPDDYDDRLRLYYVAVTRAKSNLNITRFENDESDKITNPVPVLVAKEFTKVEVPKELLSEIVAENIFDRGVYVDVTLEKLLRPLVEDYKMPVTHLWNYLDLDRDKGPKYFVENNLLRFPCSKNASSSYGTAIHAALQQYYNKLKINPKFSEQDLIKEFILALDGQNLEEKDYQHYREKGIASLKFYYYTREPEANYKTEVDFGFYDVLIGEARVTGKIDKIVIKDNGAGPKLLTVVDYKTGKGFPKFTSSGAKNQENYKSQLLFYKLMIENSAFLESNFKIESLCLDFVEKGENNGIKELDFGGLDIDTEELKLLINIVYKKIINLQFDVPQEIANSKSTNKNRDFINWLIEENKK